MAEPKPDPTSFAIKVDWSTCVVVPGIEAFWRNRDPAESPDVFWAEQEAYAKANPPY